MARGTKEGIVNIHGKEYKTVALRVSEFKKEFPTFSLTTEIVSMAEYVVMKASIGDESGRILATGHAEEKRGSTQINRTSALENCETSAIGRALAAFGLAGSEFASADEVANAIHQQNRRADAQVKPSPELKQTMDAMVEVANAISVDGAQQALADRFGEDREAALDWLQREGLPVPSKCDSKQLREIVTLLQG